MKPSIIHQAQGRAQYIAGDGKCYVSRKYDILASDDWGQSWRLDCRVPACGWKHWAAAAEPLARLLRHNIQAFQVLSDGSRLAVARDGIYRAASGETLMTKVFTCERGSRPLNLCCEGPLMIFGEYGDGYENEEVFLYVSADRGKTWEIGYRFPSNDIRHVHNVIFDPYESRYWVLVGDFNRQPGIGLISQDFKNIDWLTRGSQKSRAVGALITPDCIYYGTDSDRERNFIMRLDKRSGKLARLREVEGSSLYAAAFGPVYAISTAVEPNPACPSRECSLYISRDGDRWERTMPHRKDLWNPMVFQFGCLVLPYSHYHRARGMVSGQAVCRAHDCVSLLDFE